MREITRDKALSLYGIALSLSFILSIYHWYDTGGFTFASTDEPWCWPFYSQCWQHRMTLNQSILLFCMIGFGAFVSLVFFTLKRINTACLFLFLTWLITLALVLQDFRFRSNQFYMLSWVTIVYLFVPFKRASLAAVIISFYFWAGRLKLNWEWISGSGLYSELWGIPAQYNSIACIYVIILEMILVWGLLSRSKLIFWGTFLQVVLFHIQSFSQVTYWYPILMFLLLSFFPLTRLFSNAAGRPGLASRRTWPTSAWLVTSSFAICQIIPIRGSDIPLRIDSTRFLALHMFEARYICNIEIEKILKDKPVERITVDLPLAPRMKCDPVIYWNYARSRCAEWASNPSFTALNITMKVRKSSQQDMKELFIAHCEPGDIDQIMLPKAPV